MIGFVLRPRHRQIRGINSGREVAPLLFVDYPFECIHPVELIEQIVRRPMTRSDVSSRVSASRLSDKTKPIYGLQMDKALVLSGASRERLCLPFLNELAKLRSACQIACKFVVSFKSPKK